MFRVIDFETTGIPSEDNPQAVCEAGWTDVMEVMGQWQVGPTTDMITNPRRPMPVEALAVHHITDEMTAAGCAVDVAFRRLNEPQPVIFVAHNADFERQFFAPKAQWICTYKVALRLWPDAPAHTNQILRYWLNLPVDQERCMPPHRAGPDSHVTAHLLARILSEGGTSVADMLRWSNGPALLPRITFGNKFKGQPWEEADSGYLDWIVTKSDLSKDVKANARHHLKLRKAAQ